MIKTLIFDLGGVYFTDGAKRVVDVFSRKFSLDKDVVATALQGELASKYRMGHVTEDQFWNQLKVEWSITGDNQTLGMMWHTEYEPIAGTVSLIDQLKKQGFEILFLSDNAPERIAYLERAYNFSKHFTGGVYSHNAGVRKPHPRMYEEVLKKTTSKPEECLYIDDKENNLTPAQDLGMNAVLFVSPEDLKQALAGFGVSID